MKCVHLRGLISKWFYCSKNYANHSLRIVYRESGFRRKKNVVSIFGRYQRCRHLLRESGCCVTMSNVIRIMGGCLNVDYFLFSSPFPNALTKEYSFTFMLFHSFTPIPRPNNQFWGDNVSAVAFEMLVSSFKAYSKWVFGCTRTEVVIMVPFFSDKNRLFSGIEFEYKIKFIMPKLCIRGSEPSNSLKPFEIHICTLSNPLKLVKYALTSELLVANHRAFSIWIVLWVLLSRSNVILYEEKLN